MSEKTEDLSVFVLVTMANSMEDVTVNLQGPLLFNPEKKLGLQFIIPDGKYSTRHSLFGDKINIISFFPTKALFLEIGFVLSKFIGFYICLNTFYASNTMNIIFLLVIFTLSWSLGLVVPAAPGGVGVFEACLLLYVGKSIPENIILISLVYFRVISTSADLFLSLPFLIRKLYKRI